MVGKVLRNRGIVEKEGSDYVLKGFASLAPDEVRQLVAACKVKLNDFKETRGATVWAHRRMSTGYIPGTLKFEVLKRARLRCELCGISGEEKALEADHIVPRNKGGSDDLSNLQALCYSCNANEARPGQHRFPRAFLRSSRTRLPFSAKSRRTASWPRTSLRT
jgi:ATP adenylyltransferase